MSVAILVGIAACLLFIAALALGVAAFGTPDFAKRIRPEAAPDAAEHKSGWLAYLKKSERLVRPLGGLIPRSTEEMSRQERRLANAGIRRKDGPLLLYGAKASLAILLLVGFASTRVLFSNPFLYVVLSVFFGALLPDLWINHRISTRNYAIQRALPNALDLAVVCVEAGMGLDQALMLISREMRAGAPELSEEFHLLTLEVNAGRKRTDALRNLANRTDNNDLKALVATLIQTDRFGTSIAQSLQVYSESMRSTLQMRAEEHAAKMGIKMLAPLVFFILPAMFIVILGPAVIAIVRELIPALTGK
jgi:tight adherence protein C